jgi:hypothetical protein
MVMKKKRRRKTLLFYAQFTSSFPKKNALSSLLLLYIDHLSFFD